MPVTAILIVVCPHCGGRSLTCHACHDSGRLHWLDLPRVMGFVWALAGCDCQACKVAGKVPGAR